MLAILTLDNIIDLAGMGVVVALAVQAITLRYAVGISGDIRELKTLAKGHTDKQEKAEKRLDTIEKEIHRIDNRCVRHHDQVAEQSP